MKTHAGKCRTNINMGFNHDMTPAECDCDGYHTFTELYNHRITLFIALCRVLVDTSEAMYQNELPRNIYYRNGNVWRSKKHRDGSKFDGWFIMGIRTDAGHQISYHLPLDRWDETDFAYTLDRAPEWDGHTSDDVITRLKAL